MNDVIGTSGNQQLAKSYRSQRWDNIKKKMEVPYFALRKQDLVICSRNIEY